MDPRPRAATIVIPTEAHELSELASVARNVIEDVHGLRVPKCIFTLMYPVAEDLNGAGRTWASANNSRFRLALSVGPTLTCPFNHGHLVGAEFNTEWFCREESLMYAANEFVRNNEALNTSLVCVEAGILPAVPQSAFIHKPPWVLGMEHAMGSAGWDM
eukprot:3804396-Amphidinium_carterae.1